MNDEVMGSVLAAEQCMKSDLSRAVILSMLLCDLGESDLARYEKSAGPIAPAMMQAFDQAHAMLREMERICNRLIGGAASGKRPPNDASGRV